MQIASREFSGIGVDLCITGFLRIHPTSRALLENQLALHEIMPARIAAYRWTNKQINQLHHPTLQPFPLRSTKQSERLDGARSKVSGSTEWKVNWVWRSSAVPFWLLKEFWQAGIHFFLLPNSIPKALACGAGGNTPQRSSANNLWA